MRDRQTCIGCGKKSPETETNYTLISAQFGWRLTRYRNSDGAIVIEWRCPACWREYKKAKGESPVSATSSADGREAAPPYRRSHVDAAEANRPSPTPPSSPPRARYSSSPSSPPTPRVAPPATPIPPKTGRTPR